MQGTTLLEQGLSLMLVGMGTVFVFLTALVLAMTVMAAIVGAAVPWVQGYLNETQEARVGQDLDTLTDAFMERELPAAPTRISR